MMSQCDIGMLEDGEIESDTETTAAGDIKSVVDQIDSKDPNPKSNSEVKLNNSNKKKTRKSRWSKNINEDDWATNVQNAIAKAINKSLPELEVTAVSSEEENMSSNEPNKCGKKRNYEDRRGDKRSDKNSSKDKTKNKENNKKRKTEPVAKSKTENALPTVIVDEESLDEDELICVRGASLVQKEPLFPPEPFVPVYPTDIIGSAYDPYASDRSGDSDKSYCNRRRSRHRERNGRYRQRTRERQRRRNNNKGNYRRNRRDSSNGSKEKDFEKKNQMEDQSDEDEDDQPIMELCKFYLMNCCAKKKNCRYMHSEFPCKYYHTGLKCVDEDVCKFSHGNSLTNELRIILLKHIETAPRDIIGDYPRLSKLEILKGLISTQSRLQKDENPSMVNPTSSIPSLLSLNFAEFGTMINDNQFEPFGEMNSKRDVDMRQFLPHKENNMAFSSVPSSDIDMRYSAFDQTHQQENNIECSQNNKENRMQGNVVKEMENEKMEFEEYNNDSNKKKDSMKIIVVRNEEKDVMMIDNDEYDMLSDDDFCDENNIYYNLPPVIEEPSEILSKLGNPPTIDISDCVSKLVNKMASTENQQLIENSFGSKPKKSLFNLDQSTNDSLSECSMPNPCSNTIRSPEQLPKDILNGDIDLRNISDHDMRNINFAISNVLAGFPNNSDTDLRNQNKSYHAMKDTVEVPLQLDQLIDIEKPFTFKLAQIKIPEIDYSKIIRDLPEDRIRLDPRLRKFSKASEGIVEPVLNFPRVDPRINDPKIFGLDFKLILQTSDWYNNLDSNQKIFVNKELSILITNLRQFTRENDKLDTSFIYRNLSLCSILSNLEISINDQGQFVQLNENKNNKTELDDKNDVSLVGSIEGGHRSTLLEAGDTYWTFYNKNDTNYDRNNAV